MTDINTRAAAIRKTAEAHGQEHVFRFWKDLDTVGREQLITQLEALDWERLDDWIEAYVLASPELEISTDLKPAEYYPAIPETPHQEQLYSEAMSLGRRRAGDAPGIRRSQRKLSNLADQGENAVSAVRRGHSAHLRQIRCHHPLVHHDESAQRPSDP
jgi:hypothetical protein